MIQKIQKNKVNIVTSSLNTGLKGIITCDKAVTDNAAADKHLHQTP